MNENFTYWSDLADKKIQNRLSEQDNTAFETLVSQNADFKEFYEKQKQLATGIKLAERQRLKTSLKMQLEAQNETISSSAKSRFSYIFWLSQYSAAIWLVTLSTIIALSGMLLYRTWQNQTQKKQLALQWQKAEDLLEEPNKKQEIILSKPKNPTHTHPSPSQKETAVVFPQPSPKGNVIVQRAEKTIEEKKDADKQEEEFLADDIVKAEEKEIKTNERKTEKNTGDVPIQVLSNVVEEDKTLNEKKPSAKLKKEDNKQKDNIKEFYLPVYALRIQDEVQNKNFTAAPENIRSGKDIPRSTKSTIGPKVFITQYTDKKVLQDNVWYYDFNLDNGGEHLYIYADFEQQSLQLYIDRNPSPVKYYLKTKKGTYMLYPNQTQKLAEPVTDKKILKYLE